MSAEIEEAVTVVINEITVAQRDLAPWQFTVVGISMKLP